jgi:hypothetical protein
MFGNIKKGFKLLFSRLIKHKRNSIDENNTVEYDYDYNVDSYDIITQKLIEAFKEYDETMIIKEERPNNDFKKNLEKVLRNKLHRKDKHKKNHKKK